MPLRKTVSYPQDAIDNFIRKPALKMIVFGNNYRLLQIADNLAQNPSTPVDRGVIYITSGSTGPIPIALTIAIPELSNIDLTEVRAISVSSKTCATIPLKT